jgi:MFS transporter, DHA1 family, tetracycline resistance protein
VENVASPTPPPVRRATFIFIFVTVALDMLAFGVLIPVLPQLIKSMVGGDTVTAAYWVGIISTTFALMQFVFTPIQGALSDRFGRRPIILLSNLGLGLDFVVMALVQSVPWLMAARVISGATAASFSTANAYIADVTEPAQRAKAFGMLGAAFGIGFVIGPAFGGMLGNINLRLPFWAAAALALINFCYGYFILPESLPPEKRSARFDWRHANPIGALVLIKRYPQVFGLAAVVFLSNLAHYALQSTFVLYADYRYHWGPQEVGYTLAFVGVCSAIAQAVLVGKLTPRFGERNMVLVGIVFGMLGFAIQGAASTGWLSLLAIPMLALWGLAGPNEQAIMTRQVDPREQGRLQGAIASLASLAGIFGPTLHTQVFAAAIGAYAGWHLPGMNFFMSAALLIVAWLIAYRVTDRNHLAMAPVSAQTEADVALASASVEETRIG